MTQQDEGRLNQSVSGEGENGDSYGDSRFGRAEDAPVRAEGEDTDGHSRLDRTESAPEPEDPDSFGIRRTEGSDEGSDTEEFWRMSQI